MTPKEGQNEAEKAFVASWEKDTQKQRDVHATNDRTKRATGTITATLRRASQSWQEPAARSPRGVDPQAGHGAECGQGIERQSGHLVSIADQIGRNKSIFSGLLDVYAYQH